MSPELRSELMDDFYAECDELLALARTQLARLEQLPRGAAPDASLWEQLLRAMHSFKGNSAIVGLRAAEELTHVAEAYLRRVSAQRAGVGPAMIDLLVNTTQRLEQIVAAHRLQQPLPEIVDLIGPLAGDGIPDAPAEEEGAAAEARPALWRCTFVPSSERDRRGINVNSVRARLKALGEIVSATPSVCADGSIRFDFTVNLREDPAELGAWESDGIVWRPEQAAVAVPSAEPGPRADPAGPASLFIAPSHIVRVELGRLDELMRIAGEMVIQRSRLADRIERLGGDRTGLQEVNLSLERSLRELRDALTRTRLVPIAEIFTRMPFVVRDLARTTGKRVRLAIEGEGTEIDKYLVERLKEPLLHLVRNAVSHGVEPAEQRLAAGKPAEAVLQLRAYTVGQGVVIQVRDDGGGIDAARIAEQASAAGHAVPDTPSEAELLEILCRPGFSTRDEADLAAGRGVGMAVVHNTVRELGGSLSLATKVGAWTQFTLRLPLTLSIADTFLVTAGPHTCAIPQGFVEEILQVQTEELRTIQNVEVASYRDGVLPLLRLRALFAAEPAAGRILTLAVLSTETGLIGLVVDRVVGKREVVIRSIQDPLVQVPGISGATELGDGRPVLILDPPVLAHGAVRPRAAGGAGARRRAEPVSS